MDTQTEDQVLQKISALEAMEQEYYAEHTARSIAMQLGPGDDRAVGLFREREVHETAFRRLIGSEKLKLQKIRAAEEERRRAEARAAKEREDREMKATKEREERERKVAAEEAMKRHEDAVQRAMANILANM
jgi:hypothetical protein